MQAGERAGFESLMPLICHRARNQPGPSRPDLRVTPSSREQTGVLNIPAYRFGSALLFWGDDWMAYDYARAFYKSRAWQLCRASYIAKRQSVDGGMCERCHRQPGYIVHHKVHITPANISNPDVTLNHDNLQYLCKACHDEVHGYCGNQKEPPRCEFDENGNPVPRSR